MGGSYYFGPAQGCASDRAICIHTYIHYACIVMHYNHTYQYTVRPLYDIMFMNKCGYYSFELGARLTCGYRSYYSGCGFYSNKYGNSCNRIPSKRFFSVYHTADGGTAATPNDSGKSGNTESTDGNNGAQGK